MSMPNTIYESKLAHNEMRHERSMAIHNHLMHLPQGDSVIKRLVRWLREATSRAIETAPRPSVAENFETKRPAAFSK